MVYTLAQSIPAQSLNQVAPFLFFGFAALTVVSAWAIVLSQNIVRMAIYLLFTLCGVAGLFFLMNAEFLAAIQLIVYAGGTLILIVFGVMLTSKDPFQKLVSPIWEQFLGCGIGLALLFLLVLAMANSVIVPHESLGTAPEHGVRAIGKALLSEYIVPFEVSAVLLLVVMIGAAYMARRRA